MANRDMCGERGHAWQRGVFVAKRGGMHGKGGMQAKGRGMHGGGHAW